MASKPLAIAVVKGLLTRWVAELGSIWLGVLFFSVVPAVLFGSAIFSLGFLAASVLIGVPSALFGSAKKNSESRGARCLAIMLVVPALILAYVSEVDEQIPENATPLVQAIESFRCDTGHYPESLDALMPKLLAKLPAVRFSVIQPRITYRIVDGKPYLAIPSASGDMFAQYEYNFETKVWIHHS